jgi:hypothetical protein
MRILLIALATLATTAIIMPIASQAEDAVVIKNDNDHWRDHHDKKTVVIKEREHRDHNAVVIKEHDHDHHTTTGVGVGIGLHVGD